MTTRTLATKIATALLTVYDRAGGIECTRAQMMLSMPDGQERDMGGRNKDSMIQEIESVLKKHAHELE